MSASLPSEHPDALTVVPVPRNGTRREIWAWACYDWANSAYSTLYITILWAYITRVVYSDADGSATNLGTLVWSYGIGVSMFFSAIISPVLGAVADAHASKRGWLAITALGGATASVAMGLSPAHPILVGALFISAQVLFELSFTFYNGFLPEIADETQLNRVSSWGFGAGYIGGGLALLLAMCVFIVGPSLGLESRESQLRAGLVIMGVWWGGFTLPTILVLRDRRSASKAGLALQQAVREAFGEVWHTLKNIRRFRTLSIFLAGFLLYNEGVNTVLSQASEFAGRVVGMDAMELTQVVLLIQFAAFPGALLIGWLADRWGQKPALMLCLAGWTVLLLAAYFVTTRLQFWGLAAVLALIMGGTQSVSRSIMGYMTPASRTAEFMGFFSLSQKATSMIGPMIFGTVVVRTGNAHLAILSLLGFILLGWAVVSRIDLQRGRVEALEG